MRFSVIVLSPCSDMILEPISQLREVRRLVRRARKSTVMRGSCKDPGAEAQKDMEEYGLAVAKEAEADIAAKRRRQNRASKRRSRARRAEIKARLELAETKIAQSGMAHRSPAEGSKGKGPATDPKVRLWVCLPARFTPPLFAFSRR